MLKGILGRWVISPLGARRPGMRWISLLRMTKVVYAALVSPWNGCFTGRCVSLSESIYESGSQILACSSIFSGRMLKWKRWGEKVGWR